MQPDNKIIEFQKVLESKMKIRFHDCDPFNHLNNSRYIDYIVTARGDQLLDHYGLDIYELARQQGVAWVTGLTQIAYLSPATGTLSSSQQQKPPSLGKANGTL